MFRPIIIFLLIIFPINIYAQDSMKHTMKIAFYNLENLFDTEDDPETRDEEFTPEGARRWNDHRFYKKIYSTFKVLVAMGEWEPPAFVGFCEVENREVVNSLIFDSPLKFRKYSVIHFDSPDKRGIDVAAIYRHDILKLLVARPLKVAGKNGLSEERRNILYAEFEIPGKDTIHIFVNHWPSRYGGYTETAGDRFKVAEILKDSIDKILIMKRDAKIILMGDFNDEPADMSLLVLSGRQNVRDSGDSSLINLMEQKDYLWQGTIKHEGQWFIFDQLLVSKALISDETGVVIDGRAEIFDPDFLLEDDLQYTGKRPCRTYNGYKYNGGFSDHLPVYLDLIVK